MNDRNVHQFAAFARVHLHFYGAAVPINQANVIFGVIRPYRDFPVGKPGYAMYGWRIENAQVFCTAVVATATVGIDNELVTIFSAVTPVAGTVVQATFSSAVLASRTGKIGDRLNIRCTTNGTGTITNLLVAVTIRPFPLSNEAA